MAERSNVFTKAQVSISFKHSRCGPRLLSERNVSGSVKSVELSRTFDMLDDTGDG